MAQALTRLEAPLYVWACAGVLFVFFIGRIFYNVFLHPISKIPGPAAAGASDAWLTWNTFRLRKCEALHESLARYGPVVRIAPNKVVVSRQEDIKKVYGIGTKCLKSQFYPPWGLDEQSNIFSTVDPKDHSVRRSITARTFAKNSIVQFMPELTKHARALVTRLDILSEQNEPIEFIKIARYLALDMLGSAVLDEDFGLLEKGIEHPFVHDLDAATVVIPARAILPAWAWAVVKRMPVPKLQWTLAGESRLAKYASETVQRVSDKGESKSLALVSSYANYRDAEGHGLDTDRIVGEIAAAYFAGTDTTSTSLGFAAYEIARRPDIQRRLRDELLEKADGNGYITHDVLEKDCHYLNAIIFEVLRIYGAIPSHLERVVPAGGLNVSTGFHIPAGTIIGTQPYSLHRDEAVFPDPEFFSPERWIDASPEMRKAYSPWGFGSRICMGMHLAYIELRLALASLVGNFNVQLPPKFDPKSMNMKNFWFVFPQGGKVNIVVSKLDAEKRVTIY